MRLLTPVTFHDILKLSCNPEDILNLGLKSFLMLDSSFLFPAVETECEFCDSKSNVISFKVPEELAPSPPISTPRNSGYERIKFTSLAMQPSGVLSVPRTLSSEEKKMTNHGMIKTPPPLPPRNISSSQIQVPKIGTKVSLCLTFFGS